MEAQRLSQLLPEAVPKKELQQPEQRELPHGISADLSLALTSTRIQNATTEDISQVLRYAMRKIGLRANNWPSGLENALLLDHLKKLYGGNCVDEIKLAFDLAIEGKLNVEVNCYENFSCLYFSSIMNEYRRWASSQMLHAYMDDIDKKQVLLEEKQLDDIKRRDIEEAYQRMRRGMLPLGLPDYYKEILVKDGLMKKDDNISDFFTSRLERSFKNIYVPS